MDIDKKNPRLIWRLRVPSKSQKGTFHIVEIYDSGDMRCPCWANEHGKICSHMVKTMDYIKALSLKTVEKYGKRDTKQTKKSIQG